MSSRTCLGCGVLTACTAACPCATPPPSALCRSAGGSGSRWCSAPSSRPRLKDCAEHRIIVQYVGELCRYLVCAAERAGHEARRATAFGNGLRPEVSPAAELRHRHDRRGCTPTEGNANLANTVGREGAVGFIFRYRRPCTPSSSSISPPTAPTSRRAVRTAVRSARRRRAPRALGLVNQASHPHHGTLMTPRWLCGVSDESSTTSTTS